jgi:uncharacterized membrane protein
VVLVTYVVKLFGNRRYCVLTGCSFERVNLHIYKICKSDNGISVYDRNLYRTYGYAVLIVKAVLGSVFSGNVSSLLYSLPAGLIALTVEVILLRFDKVFGLVSISVLGAIINLVAQNGVFCLVTGVPEYLAYSPYLSLIGILSGAVIGVTVYLIYNKLPKSVIEKITN